jgi:hypothetical protein
MRLNELKPKVGNSLIEGVIPPYIYMPLQQIVTDGKVTDNVQIFTLAGALSMFKGGGPSRWPREAIPSGMYTSSDAIEAVKSLEDEEHVRLAQMVLNKMFDLEDAENQPQSVSTLAWIRSVLARQD